MFLWFPAGALVVCVFLCTAVQAIAVVVFVVVVQRLVLHSALYSVSSSGSWKRL